MATQRELFYDEDRTTYSIIISFNSDHCSIIVILPPLIRENCLSKSLDHCALFSNILLG